MNSNLQLFRRPDPFQPGTMTLWSDAYIASNVLKTHLDGSYDSGSRKEATIEKSVRWLADRFADKQNVLDVGCGPGLYAPRLCKCGFSYEGIDISPWQVEYAAKHNAVQDKTTYHVGDFRTWKSENKYDLVLMLYGIYSFYSPIDRAAALHNLRQYLKPSSCVVVEVFTKQHYANREESRDWTYVERDGFWYPGSYLELNAFRRYDAQNLVLIQTGVLAEQATVWNSWIQTFEPDSLRNEFYAAGFRRFEFYGSCTGDPLTDDSEVLCMCVYDI